MRTNDYSRVDNLTPSELFENKVQRMIIDMLIELQILSESGRQSDQTDRTYVVST